jgi:hypothetical protein
VRFYRKRMWIEELFGDWQGGGFRLGAFVWVTAGSTSPIGSRGWCWD